MPSCPLSMTFKSGFADNVFYILQFLG